MKPSLHELIKNRLIHLVNEDNSSTWSADGYCDEAAEDIIEIIRDYHLTE